jgi:hypothetical protein
MFIPRRNEFSEFGKQNPSNKQGMDDPKAINGWEEAFFTFT